MAPKAAERTTDTPDQQESVPVTASRKRTPSEAHTSVNPLYDRVAHELEDLARCILEEAKQRLATGQDNAGLKYVGEIFPKLLGEEPQPSHHFEELKKDPANALHIVKFDQKLALANVKADSDFEGAVVTCESKIRTAKNAWITALREYRTVYQFITATFRASLHAAKPEASSTHPSDNAVSAPLGSGASRTPNPVYAQVHHVTRTIALAGALEQYEKDMGTAMKALTTALANLISQLTDAFAQLSQSEVSHMKSVQHSFLEYWTSAQTQFTARPTTRQ